MASDDWAIVVGINRYPYLRDLAGPENDALAFLDWVTSGSGGAVPRDHCRLLVSSNFADVSVPGQARPNAADLGAVFDGLLDVAEDNNREGKGFRVGRRLYIYLAGQGYKAAFDQPVLLSADASARRVGKHIPGKLYARWFLRAGCFTEVALFMDCSRVFLPVAPVNAPPYADMFSDAAVDSRLFYVTSSSRSVPERVIGGVVRGVLTTAVVEGLRGAASQPDGRITAAALARYLYVNVKNFAAPEELTDPAVSFEPEVGFEPSDGKDFVLVDLPLQAIPVHPVSIFVGAYAIGKRVEVLNHEFKVVASLGSASENEWRLQLPQGLYLAKISDSDQQRVFDVRGAGRTHVSL